MYPSLSLYRNHLAFLCIVRSPVSFAVSPQTRKPISFLPVMPTFPSPNYKITSSSTGSSQDHASLCLLDIEKPFLEMFGHL
jgi:hypothetical protein